MVKNMAVGFAMFIFAAASSGIAADVPRGLIDSKPDKAVLMTLDEWYAKHPAQKGKTDLISETIASSPRSMVMVRIAPKGLEAPLHYHATSDEIMIMVGGSGEIYVNGKWTPVKAGDIHVNPRGIVHSTRALKEELRFISIFTPQLAPGGDANKIN